jgi:hypothetical protein
VAASGRGEVYNFNVMRIKSTIRASAADVPYAVVVVTLEQEPKLVSNLLG